MTGDISGYKWDSPEFTCAHDYVLPTVEKLLSTLEVPDRCLFELGCGNGATASRLVDLGWSVTGIDPSIEGIVQANRKYPHIPLKLGSAYDDLRSEYGQYPVVLSLEVVEHVYSPRDFARTLFDLVCPGGGAIVSTPYHGYWKNLALALTGKMDAHFTALWDHGHIKFWSIVTLRTLLEEAGFRDIVFYRVGRIPLLAKSMIAVAHRPVSPP